MSYSRENKRFDNSTNQCRTTPEPHKKQILHQFEEQKRRESIEVEKATDLKIIAQKKVKQLRGALKCLKAPSHF